VKIAAAKERFSAHQQLGVTFRGKLQAKSDFKQGGGGIEICSGMSHLDYISCVLTISSTFMVGRHKWYGWVVAAVNSIIICIIGVRARQYGLVPANLFCLGLYAGNVFAWRKNGVHL
jgi:hypothetical protein